MDDLISRSALLEAFGEEPLVWDSRDREDVQMHNDWLDYTKLVKEAPTIEAEPVVHAKWVDRYGNKYDNHLWECSECKEKALWRFEVDGWGRETEVQDLSDYCPNCGAKMDGDTE